jgi:hypothetical protein
MKNAAPRPGHEVATTRSVIRGLDPRIHRSSKKHFRSGWIAGSKPGNDAVFVEALVPALEAKTQPPTASVRAYRAH